MYESSKKNIIGTEIESSVMGIFLQEGYLRKKTTLKIIKTYNLRKNSSILDIGCGKGYLLFEIRLYLQ